MMIVVAAALALLLVSDLTGARLEGRTNLGGDIFIHGKSVSIGCLAIGDPAIEDLYLLLADVGLARARIVIAPNARPDPTIQPQWVGALYARIGRELRVVRGADAGTKD